MASLNTLFNTVHPTPGVDIKLQNEAFVKTKKIKAGWIVTGVRSLVKAHLRLAGQRQGTTYEVPFEIVTLAGTLRSSGMHIHFPISDSYGFTIGGHLMGVILFTPLPA